MFHRQRNSAGPARCLCALSILISNAAIIWAANPRDFLTITQIEDDDPQTDDLGRAKAHINAASYKTQSLTTVGDYQFTSYYHSDGKLLVGRRNVVKNPKVWTLLRTQFTSININDAHNVSSLAIDGDGFLHIAWGVHANPLLYTRSTASLLNDDPMRLIGANEGNAGCLADAIPLQNAPVTYPEFYNIPNSGDLLLTYRTGHSGNGEFQLVRWDNATKSWSGIHASQAPDDEDPQPWIDDNYSGDALPNVSAYYNKLVFDAKRRFHVTWSWRTGGDSTTGFKDYQSNHNLMYAYSDNEGVDWHRSDGSLYQRNGKHDIDEDNAPPVINIPEGSSLINQSSSTIGPDGKFYTATWWAPDADTGNHLRQYMLIEHDGLQWKTHQVGNRNPENDQKRVPESQSPKFSLRRPIVMVDKDNRVLLVLSDYQRGGGITIAYSENDRRDDWQFIDLTTERMGRWDPTYDLNRWQRDGILSILYQPSGLGKKAEPVSVLEWNARAYFDK